MKKVGVLAVLLASLLLTVNAVAASGPSVWSTYVPVTSIGYADRYDVPYGCSAATGSCAQNGTVAVWTPTRPITVKRLEFFTRTGVSSWLVGSAPLTGCPSAPLFTLTDGTGRYSTVGPISVSFPARAILMLQVQSVISHYVFHSAVGYECGVSAGNFNVTYTTPGRP